MTTYSLHAGSLVANTVDSGGGGSGSVSGGGSSEGRVQTCAVHSSLHTSNSTFDVSSRAVKPSSDCGGSSSGLGGMTKTDIASSDGSDLASDQAIDPKSQWSVHHPVLVNNAVPSVYVACNNLPTSSTSPSNDPVSDVTKRVGPRVGWKEGRTCVISANSANRSPLATNDLFVHVQTGETLSILVGNDVQHISGPATVRMVNQAGLSPTALPLHVPPGHMVQQILDEQGILRHLILSPETTPISRLYAIGNPPSAISSTTVTRNAAITTPLKAPQFYHENAGSFPPANISSSLPNGTAIYNDGVRRHWNHRGKRSPPQVNGSGHLIHVPFNANEEHDHSQSGASGNEDEEWERLSEMLSRMQPPQILRVAAKEADICWQELDTSEASAFGGPFPQIDASEFTYEIVLSESVNDGRIANCYRCDPGSANRVRLCRLRPNTDYFVHLRASLEERGLRGSASPSVKFRTLCCAPETPHSLRCVKRTQTSVTVCWRPPYDNGSAITEYRVELAEEPENRSDEGCQYDIVYKGIAEQTKIKNLSPSTRYLIRVCAANSEGASPMSASTLVHTAPFSLAKCPSPPQIVTLSSNSVKLSWSTLPDHSYTLEMCDSSRTNQFTSICERAQQSCANINDLICNHQYQFRLIAHNEAGDSDPSEPLILRTPPAPASSSPSPPRTPSQPHLISSSPSSLEIGWKSRGAKNKDSTSFVLEGSTNEEKWDVLYKGTGTSTVIRNNNVMAFRVAAARKKTQSGWSEVLRVRRRDMQVPVTPERCSAPSFSELSDGILRVKWAPVENASSSLIYQLLRVNVQPPTTMYKGESTMFDVTNAIPGEEMEVQVRAIATGEDGTESEGPWSHVAVGQISVKAPPPPSDVVLTNDKVLCWKPPSATPLTGYVVERELLLLCDGSPALVSSEVEPKSDESKEWTKCAVANDTIRKNVGDGKPGCEYQVRVAAVNSGGVGQPSEWIHFTMPSAAPSAPSSLRAVAEGCAQLRIFWAKPSSNGSRIHGYSIRLIDAFSGREVHAARLSCETFDHCITCLEAEHTYNAIVRAVSDIGEGEEAYVTATTWAPPPAPPQLICSEAGSHYLKLKWKLPGISVTASDLYYYLEKENENGKFSPIYEGDSRYAKVRNLNENTSYRFRIRCCSRLSGAGAWSAPFKFTTEQMPPPAIRSAPTVNEVARGCFQIEWPPLRPVSLSAGSNESLFYRLQRAPRTSSDKSNNAWKTVYEGVSPSYSLSISESVQLRVQCVRVRNGVESVSVPSAIQYVTPSIVSDEARKGSLSISSLDEAFIREDVSKLQWVQYHLFSEKHYACVILALFAALAFFVALLLNAFVYSSS